MGNLQALRAKAPSRIFSPHNLFCCGSGIISLSLLICLCATDSGVHSPAMPRMLEDFPETMPQLCRVTSLVRTSHFQNCAPEFPSVHTCIESHFLPDQQRGRSALLLGDFPGLQTSATPPLFM